MDWKRGFGLGIGALALAAFCICGQEANAWPGGHDRAPVPLSVDEWADEVGIDDDTADRIGEIQDRTRERVEELKAEIATAKAGLGDFMDAKEVDTDRAMAEAENLEELQKELRLVHTQSKLEVRALLTEDQRETLETLQRSKHHDRSAQYRHHWKKGGKKCGSGDKAPPAKCDHHGEKPPWCDHGAGK